MRYGLNVGHFIGIGHIGYQKKTCVMQFQSV